MNVGGKRFASADISDCSDCTQQESSDRKLIDIETLLKQESQPTKC